MVDLNKEREAFLNTFQYYKGRRDIIFSHEHELFMTRSNNPSDIAQKEISNMNSRWDAWLRCAKHHDEELKKAKAKVVPDTHIVVPRNREVVVAIEKMVEQQVEASGITSDVFRLDGWRILDAIQEASESGAANE
ncbi:hypothetical protein [Acinetobacter baumannii]|uniref:hypothetical protein n=1 Tax=Acinetobacter baumannii TaxID=470 RepID=UPI000810EF9B|nr:hypothetical protein [Acinetobacter baumannii]MDC4638040.1 hypothetical protein [Acinetobacter baumannii]MDC5666459.1 hypothetical protein [Acinetobacter baumannii]MDC5677891.1 hypothetical protein [Acinetobacter baumannii]MDK2201691.1 hypothetical protein [Acinetobacter baumannii]